MSKETLMEQFREAGGADLTVPEVQELIQAKADSLLDQPQEIEKGQFLLELTHLEHSCIDQMRELGDRIGRIRDMRNSAHQAEYDGLIVNYYGNDEQCWFEARAKDRAGFKKRG